MNKFIPICFTVILGLVATTSGFKCYECDSISYPDCVNNVGTKFEVTCPEIPMQGSKTTIKNEGQQKIADYIVSLLTPRNDKPLTKAIYHHCVRFIGTQAGTHVVLRMCMPSSVPYETKCETGDEGGIRGEVCVCNTELCNGMGPTTTTTTKPIDEPNGAMATKMFVILPILGALTYLLV